MYGTHRRTSSLTVQIEPIHWPLYPIFTQFMKIQMKNQTKNPISAQTIPRFTSDLLLLLILLFHILQKKLDMDFLGVAVDGSSKEDEEDDHLTQQSSGRNDRRSSGSACNIGSNPNEKPMSPEEVAYTDKRIKELLEIM